MARTIAVSERPHRRLARRKATAADTESGPGVLAPDNPIDLKDPGSSGETVNQQRLRGFYELQKEFYALRDKYLAAYAKIQDLIIQGADIQLGTYKVDYGVRLVRRPRYKQALIDAKGEAYQLRVLENTAPHAHFRVKVQ
jgi:hypothetical protein